MKSQIALIILILCLGITSALICHGQTQTNATAVNPSALPAYPDSTPADIEKVLQDFGIHINVTSIGSILFLVYMSVKFLRNKTPLGQGQLGAFLASVVNLEAKPPTTVQQQSTPPKTP